MQNGLGCGCGRDENAQREAQEPRAATTHSAVEVDATVLVHLEVHELVEAKREEPEEPQERGPDPPRPRDPSPLKACW